MPQSPEDALPIAAALLSRLDNLPSSPLSDIETTESKIIAACHTAARFEAKDEGHPRAFLPTEETAWGAGEKAVDELVALDSQEALDFALWSLARRTDTENMENRWLENMGLLTLLKLSQTDFHLELAQLLQGDSPNGSFLYSRILDIMGIPFGDWDKKTALATPEYYSQIVAFNLAMSMEDVSESWAHSLFDATKRILSSNRNARAARYYLDGPDRYLVEPLIRLMPDDIEIGDKFITVITGGQIARIDRSGEIDKLSLTDSERFSAGSVIATTLNGVMATLRHRLDLKHTGSSVHQVLNDITKTFPGYVEKHDHPGVLEDALVTVTDQKIMILVDNQLVEVFTFGELRTEISGLQEAQDIGNVLATATKQVIVTLGRRKEIESLAKYLGQDQGTSVRQDLDLNGITGIHGLFIDRVPGYRAERTHK